MARLSAAREFLLSETAARYGMLALGDAVVAGVSGGADSVALLLGLLALKEELRLSVYTAHVNHNLRGNDSQADEDFVKTICADWNVPLTVYQADVRGLVASDGLTTEDAARRLRYQYLHAAMDKYGAQKIAVAHTRDDSAETVLMNLCRGSGLKGLCGIPPVRGAVVRPLIETPRTAIEAFLAERGVPYRTDASNFDPAYTRNRVRHHLMPVLAEQLGKNAPSVIARNGLLLADDEAYLAEQARNALLTCLLETENGEGNDVSLDVGVLQGLPPALSRRVIREALRRVMDGSVTDIGAQAVEQALALLDGRTGRVTELPHGARVRREYGKLVLYRVNPLSIDGQAGGSFSITLTPDTPVFIPAMGKYICVSLTAPRYAGEYTKKFRYDNIQAFLTLRTRLPGDRIYIDGVGRRKLQDYFTDNKTPRALRDSVPLLAVGGDILWIMDKHNRTNGLYKPETGRPAVWVSVYEN